MKLRHALVLSLILHLIILALLAEKGLITTKPGEAEKAIVARLIGPEESPAHKRRPQEKHKKPIISGKYKRKLKKKRTKKKSLKKVTPKKKKIPLPGKVEKKEEKVAKRERPYSDRASIKEPQGLRKEVPSKEGSVSKRLKPPEEPTGQKKQGGFSEGQALRKAPPVLGPGALFDRDVIGKVVRRSIEKERKRKQGGVTFSTKELKYHSYMMKLKERIESIWIYPEEAARKGIYGDLWISFTIKKDGSLGEVKLLRTSGYPELDRAAMKALRDGAPYWPLPEKWKIDALTVRGHFIYNLYGMYIR